jgi:hypothetical protein
MARLNLRFLIGGVLVATGLLMLLEQFKVLTGITGFVWGLIFAAAGVYFLYRFVTNMRSEWWAVIPAAALLGIGAESLLSRVLPAWGGFFFLGALGAGFFGVYFSDRQRWWAIIPGGMLVTLGFIAIMGSAFGVEDSGGLVLIGFGLTFLLVALLARLQWAWVPGLILVILGAFIGTPWQGMANYVWPAALILGGLLLILQFARKH